MKVSLVVFFFLISKFGLSFCLPDTIANWQIYYGSRLITSGNENQHRVPLTGKIFMKDKFERLAIHYAYDATKPEWRKIVIKSGNEVLFEGTQYLKDNHPTLIDFQEVLNKKKGYDFTIQIYYSDNITREKNRFIGEIEIMTK